MAVLMPGDIVFTRGSGVLSRLIRFFSRTIGESRTMVNHVAIVVDGGTPVTAKIVEALTTVQHNSLWRYASPGNEVAVFRAKNLTVLQANFIAEEAMTYVGKTYGYLKLVTHLLDWCLMGAYVFRRLTPSDRYPICSWVVAHAYGSQGFDFGVSENAASPDDMWDFCLKNPDKYYEVLPLGRLDDPPAATKIRWSTLESPTHWGVDWAT